MGSEPSDAAQGEPAAPHSLPPQGVFGQLWDYRREAWARKFFENCVLPWRSTTRPLREVRPDDRQTLGRHRCLLSAGKQGLARLREGLNNKIRVMQRRSYGLRDEEYLRLKILTCMLPEI